MATSSAIASGRDVNKNSEKKKPAWHLQELSLYSSGKRAAINHWFNKDDGIPSLNLKRLQIYVIRQQQQQQQQQQQPAKTTSGTGTIDNGDNGLWARIKDGRSFVDSTYKFCPWQFPSDPHGTQMANLICALDPLCEIYVARVAEDAFGIKADSVIKAIEWAIQQDVDIISMSFALGSDSTQMRDMARKASDLGIIMTCSAHDDGSRTTKAYPAAYRGDSDIKTTIVLAACDDYGKLLREPDTLNYDYKLIGKDVPAGIVPFVKSTECITGSSVATALAAA
ncbi:MAG: hypothetical protein STHCBS139747_006495 [Sporothrix thermara]